MVMKMYRISRTNAEEIRKRMKETKSAGTYRRLQAVALRGEGYKNEEIAQATGYNSDWVGQLAKLYCTGGLDALTADGRKGGNNHNMTAEEENIFLAGFEEAAKNGSITTIAEIAAAYDKATGKEHESKSSVYYLLHKHGWRMVTPQTVHPGKASEAEMEASKKLTLNSEK